MARIVAFVGAIALFLFLWGSCSSCKVQKTTITRDSVVIRLKDSIRVKNLVNRKDSIVYRDSVIGIKRANAGFSIPFNSTTDTIIKKGAITIRRTVNKGVEQIDCDTDSLTILVSDLRSAYHSEQIENEHISAQFQEYKKTHSDSEVVKKSGSFGMWVRSWLGWIACIVLIAIRMWRKKTLIFW